MSNRFRVIHKQVYRIDAARIEQMFNVPQNAELVAIDWDTRDLRGIAFWYTFLAPMNLNDNVGPTRKWFLTLRGTGHPFPAGMVHLKTLVKDGYAWHLLNAGNTTDIRWACK